MKMPFILILVVGLVISCKEDEIIPKQVKLDYYEETFEIPDMEFLPKNRTEYSYDLSGRLSHYTFFSFSPDTETMVEHRHFEFSYTGGNVDQIEGFHTNSTSPYIKYSYQYEDSKVKKIIENNYAAGINSEATFLYPSDATINVSYEFSNGGSFEYEMTIEGNNILNDKTTRGAQLCSNGEYTYDQHPNPFNTLRYIDFLLTNLSVNNKLTENVNYLGCAFPNLKPESYEYVYNSDGYPIEVVTTYSAIDEIKPQSTRKYFYKLK